MEHAVVFFPFVLLTIVQLFYYHAQPDQPMSARYFLPWMACMALMSGQVFAKRGALGLFASSFAVGLAWVFSLPISIGAPQLDHYERPVNAAIVAEMLGGQSAQCDALIVTNLGMHLVVRGFSSMNRATLRALTEPYVHRLAGRELQIIDIQAMDLARPEEFRKHLQQFRGGTCRRNQLGIVFAGQVVPER
jgi:hypothetical protein